jgi:hypothetical protein
MFVQPVQVFEADAAGLRRAWERALARDVRVAIYTADLFTTMNDDDDRAAVKAGAGGGTGARRAGPACGAEGRRQGAATPLSVCRARKRLG